MGRVLEIDERLDLEPIDDKEIEIAIPGNNGLFEIGIIGGVGPYVKNTETGRTYSYEWCDLVGEACMDGLEDAEAVHAE